MTTVTPNPEDGLQTQVGQSQQLATNRTEPPRQVPPPNGDRAQSTETPETAVGQSTDTQSTATQAAAPDQQEQQARQAETQAEPPSATNGGTLDSVSVSPGTVMQGESFAVTVEGAEARAIAVTHGRRSWSLSEITTGVWWGIIAVPRDGEIGASEVAIDSYGEGGVRLRSTGSPLVVLANPAPFEEITLGGTGPTLDPAAVAFDIAVRFEQHTAVTGPPRWSGPWILPVQGEVTGVFGSVRAYDGVPSDQWHHGHDIAAQHGNPIVAAAAGTVVWTGDLVLHGLGVIVDHGAGVYSGYWHMSLIGVREGIEVAPGDYLGNIGTTGLSTGPHLHWEVIVQGIDVDPVQWSSVDQPPLPPISEEAADTIE